MIGALRATTRTGNHARALGDSVTASAPARPAAGVRERWHLGAEARVLFLVTLVVLCAFGLVTVFSASAFTAVEENRDPRFYVLRQASGVVIGLAALWIAARVDAERWRVIAWPLMIGSILAMLATLVLFGGEENLIGGSRRFLRGGSIQPAEIAKLAVIVWTSMLLVKKGPRMRRLGKGLAPFLVVIGLLSLLAALQPDLSMAMTFCLLMAVLLFVGGARTAHFVFLALLAIPLLTQQVLSRDYLRERVMSFASGDVFSEQTVAVAGEQQEQSLIAIGSGGVLGVGFGQGNQQRGWVPLAYNDFIAAIIGEEFGFFGMALLVLAFAAYAWLGFRIARNARTPFQGLVAVGLTFITVLTAYIHIGVTVNLLPNTGLTLPFISYGRSNLVLTLLMTGILMNIGSTRERRYGTDATDPFASSAR